MAVVNVTSWSDSTSAVVNAAACRLTAIEVWPHPQQANQVYLQLFNVSGATPGVTTPDMVIPVGAVATQGAGTHVTGDNVATAGPRRRKVIIPGGFRFGTACEAFCGTTLTGGTAATTTSLPGRVRFFFTVG